MAAGEPADSPYIQRACQFLLSKQNHEGGWGETFEVRLRVPRDG